MKNTRLWTAMITAAALAFVGFGFMSPAQASTQFTFDCDDGGLKGDVAPGDTIVFNHTGNCDKVRWTSDPSGNTTLTVNSASLLPTNSTVNFTSGQVEVTVGALGAWFDVAFEMTVGSPVSHGFNIVNSGGGGTNNGGTSSGAAASAPVEVSLSLDLATSGASCTEGSSATGVAGAWLTLPGAGDCTSETTPDANLLGWATTADFPVDIAQRQIDNGWGAYELFNDEGRMTAVFIPAGGATFVSAGNTLHPIWAS